MKYWMTFSGNPDRMFSKKYPGHMKYLAGINAKDMDSWVFEEAQVRLLWKDP